MSNRNISIRMIRSTTKEGGRKERESAAYDRPGGLDARVAGPAEGRRAPAHPLARARWPAILLLVVVSGCDGDGSTGAASGESVIPVAAWTVRGETIETARRWSGRLEPLLTVGVQAPRSGRIQAVVARDGDAVRAGDVLIRMVGPDLDARRATLEEQVQQREEELDRWTRLAENGAAGPGEVAEARLRVLAAREQLDELEAGIEAYQIRAPASGRVFGTSVGPGAQVAAGQVLMRVDDRTTWGVRLTVSPTETEFLEQTSRLRVRDERGGAFQVSRAVFSSEPHPSLVRVDLHVTSPIDGNHRAVEVTYAVAENVLILPWTAVAGDDGGHWVAVIIPGSPDRVERRTVQLGRAFSGGIAVSSGLEEGDRVVRYEPRSHPEGRAVRPVEQQP